MSPKIAIIGSGSIGTYIGSLLINKGYNVQLIGMIFNLCNFY